MKRLVIVLSAAVLFAGVVAAQGPAPAKVEVTSLEIQKPFPRDAVGGFGWKSEQYTRIALLVTVPGKHIVEVSTKLDSCTDDKGTDLMKEKEVVKPENNAFRELWGWHEPRISSDGRLFAMQFAGPGVPAAGATQIRLKGNFGVTSGLERKTVEAKDVEVDAKWNAKLGPFKLTWGGISGIQFQPGPQQIRPPKSDPLEGIRVNWQGDKSVISLELVSAGGKKINTRHAGSGRLSVQGQIASGGQEQYSVSETPGRCTVRITYFDKLETMNVAVDVQVGVGF